MSKNANYNSFEACQKLPPTKKVSVGGAVITVYSIGWLSFFSNRHTASLRLLERQGVLPAPILDTGSGLRFYTADEVIGYANILRSTVYGKGVSLKSQGIPYKTAKLRRKLAERFSAEKVEGVAAIIPDEAKILKLISAQYGDTKHWKTPLKELLNENSKGEKSISSKDRAGKGG